MDIRAWAALSIFVGVIVAIASGKVKSTTATLLGASVMALSGLLSGDQIVAAIDHNTVGLLVGMMIVVGILSKCGVFQYIAVKAVKVTGGRGSLILWSISFITVLLSAFLDNVTTILLVTPVVLSLCDLIGLKPLPFLMMESFASTIGGTGTLIGDPPNMIIGSIAGLSFNDFIRVMTPVALIVWGLVTLYMERCYRAELNAVNAEATARLNQVDESKLITDRRLMVKALIVIFFVLVAFVLQKQIAIEPSVSALTAAAVLLIITGIDDATIIRDEVGWTTIIYFVSLFVMGGGLRATGVITAMAHGIAAIFSGSHCLHLHQQRGFRGDLRLRRRGNRFGDRHAGDAAVLGIGFGRLSRRQRQLPRRGRQRGDGRSGREEQHRHFLWIFHEDRAARRADLSGCFFRGGVRDL